MEFDWDSFWGLIWYSLVIFAFIAYLMVLFSIIIDLFWRDRETSGWVKAIWVIFLIVFPYITALVYLIARGKGMAERSRTRPSPPRGTPTTYIREAAGKSPAQEIADAKALLDAGTITQQEYDSLKAKALG